MSLLMPAMLSTNLSSSQKSSSNSEADSTIAFMKIDCEVVDTQLVYFKLNEIPTSYMKIIHHDYFTQQQPEPSQQQADYKEFFNSGGI